MDPYLFKQSVHKDFHYTLSLILDFLKDKYGEDEMVSMIKDVARVVYAPLIKDLKEKGLMEIEDHIKKVMQLEDGKYEVKKSNGAVIFNVKKCPAISYMNDKKMKISENFCKMTTKLILGEIAKAAGYKFSVDYNQNKGKCVQKFWKE